MFSLFLQLNSIAKFFPLSFLSLLVLSSSCWWRCLKQKQKNPRENLSIATPTSSSAHKIYRHFELFLLLLWWCFLFFFLAHSVPFMTNYKFSTYEILRACMSTCIINSNNNDICHYCYNNNNNSKLLLRINNYILSKYSNQENLFWLAITSKKSLNTSLINKEKKILYSLAVSNSIQMEVS